MTQAIQIMSSGFDIEQLNSSDVEHLHKITFIVDADGNDKCGFYIASKNSTEYQEAARQARIDGLKRSSKRKTALDTSTDEGAGAVAKIIEASEISLACSVVKDWFGFESKGKAAPFDKTVVRQMLSKFPTWKDKITSALDNDANFLKG